MKKISDLTSREISPSSYRIVMFIQNGIFFFIFTITIIPHYISPHSWTKETYLDRKYNSIIQRNCVLLVFLAVEYKKIYVQCDHILSTREYFLVYFIKTKILQFCIDFVTIFPIFMHT